MTGPKDYEPAALVPEHMTMMGIENLPLEQVFYVTPGERDDYDSPAIFVTPDRQLMMSRSHPIHMDDEYPPTPLERVGVMHVPLMDAATGTVRDAYVADLRFMVDNELCDIDLSSGDISDQESYMAMVDMLNDTVTFDAFIASEPGYEIDDPKVPGTFYGNPQFHPYLEIMRKRGNRLMKKFMQREAAPVAEKKATLKKDESKNVEKSAPKEKQKDSTYLTNPFLRPSN